MTGTLLCFLENDFYINFKKIICICSKGSKLSVDLHIEQLLYSPPILLPLLYSYSVRQSEDEKCR